MSSTSLQRRKLIVALRDKVLPWALSGDFRDRFVVAQPPIALPKTVTATFHPGNPLRYTPGPRSFYDLQTWPEQDVHSTRFAYLGCVIEGEVDWRIGVTQDVAQRHPDELGHCDYQILSMPVGTFFLMPPGVPYSVAGIHWERPQPEKATSQIFWLQILSVGALCHCCHTHNGDHEGDNLFFLHDAQLNFASEVILKELQLRLPGYETVTQMQLITLLRWALRSLDSTLAAKVSGSTTDLGIADSSRHLHGATIQGAAAVGRACNFIESNLGLPIDIDSIAAHIHTSRTHVNRMFRAELGMTVMQFVIQRRVEIAKSLLATTNLAMRDVGSQIGYPNPSYFSQFFLQHTQMTPKEYRSSYLS